jgi:hypothetical protein
MQTPCLISNRKLTFEHIFSVITISVVNNQKEKVTIIKFLSQKNDRLEK